MRKQAKKRCGAWFSFCLFIVRVFTKRKKVQGEPMDEPCVYLCRHRDQSGVIDAFTNINKVMRPWVLHIFTDYNLAKKHLKEYTFSQKDKRGKLFSAIVAPIAAFGMTSLVKSGKGIPVYRNNEGMRSIITIKNSVKAIENGENILIFPDVDYAAKDGGENREIYQGFALIDKLYFKRNQKHIPFVPVYMDKKRLVYHAPVYMQGNEEEFFERIVNGIYSADEK